MAQAHKAPDLNFDAPEILSLIRAALDEDLGAAEGEAAGDLTANTLVPAHATVRARILAKQDLVLAGLPVVERVFRALDASTRLIAKADEGTEVARGFAVAQIEGNARAILTGERTALNFLAHLSGVATFTRRFVTAIGESQTRIRDTRKTTPLLRTLEKYAVRLGGGTNHRFGLWDAMLVKENHIALAGSVTEAVRRALQQAAAAHGLPPEMTAYESFQPVDEAPLPVEVEVRNEAELREALAAGADSILLDNVFPTEAARLVRIARQAAPNCVIEVSGGVNLTNVRAYAEAGVDYVAIGALTHSAPAADLTLLVDLPPIQ